MEQLKNVIREELNRNLNQIIISNQRKKDAVKKVKIRPVLIKDELYFQASETVDKKEISYQKILPVTGM